jgi:hypothetical protein
MTDQPVKQCPNCGEWFTLRDIVESPSIQPRGMALEGEMARYNLFYFDHCRENCRTTFTMRIEDFSELIDEPVPQKALAGSEDCTRQCMKIDDLSLCDQPCRYAPYRRFLLSTLSRTQEKK